MDDKKAVDGTTGTMTGKVRGYKVGDEPHIYGKVFTKDNDGALLRIAIRHNDALKEGFHSAVLLALTTDIETTIYYKYTDDLESYVITQVQLGDTR